ncbi:RAMP superfamily CRISPR-associated protein [Clostridium sp. Marseille-P2415]|uniref:RAMP superfamily CRISPR-associated protein n=1 Tax=Clostridium sp. Marseille-P2415 TaxID=1805471 RepID=UPI0009888369|nr:RAMP superfamily CRISPR-associated protein [Clostridium sp. Marseille-P2415]
MENGWWLIITLKSDLCTGTGDGIEGLIDIDIAHENGIPVIPAKRLKGCLLDSGRELMENGLVEPEQLEFMFGKPGKDSQGALHIGSAFLYQVPGEILGDRENGIQIEDYNELQKEILGQEELGIQEILELLTRLRSRTAIEEISGNAKQGSLRTMRVVRNGIRFRSRIDLLRDMDDDSIMEALSWCVKGLRHIGLGVTRGFGEVTCELQKIEDDRQTEFLTLKEDGFKPDEEVELNFEIELTEPVLLAGKKGLYEDCEEWITGSSVRGALAAMFLEDHHLGTRAHEHEVFRRIFLRDGVQFGYGFLKKKNLTFYPCPASIVKWKTDKHHFNENEICFDRLYENDQSKRRKDIHSLAAFRGDCVCLAAPQKEMRMHHARPRDRGIGHALGDRAKQPEGMGQFYQYVSLKKGQIFAGCWRGRYQDINLLLQCLKKRNNHFQLGRSRTAEYGSACFTPQVPRKKVDSATGDKAGNHWVIQLLTPMVLYNWKKARPEADSELLCSLWNEEQNIGAEIKEKYLKFTHIGGYNSRWRLPESQMPALAAGTVLVVETHKPVSGEWFESRRFGEMTGIGYGMVKAVPFGEGPKEFKVISWEEDLPEIQKESSLMRALREYRSKRLIRQRERLEALNTKGRCQLNSTAIEQLISMLPQGEDQPYQYMLTRLAEIRDEEKKMKMKKFLEPCKNKSRAFIEVYLEKEKWGVRNGTDRQQ